MLPVARTIPVQDWMTISACQRVMAALQGKGADPQALFVGGCVRNTLLGLPVDDVDIATVHTPPETIRRLEAAGINVVPIGIDHGTVMAVADGTPFEVTTLRRDVETDGRHAVVTFTADWSEDAQRRDFTVNTLLADGAGNIYDPTGKGLPDVDMPRIVFVGNPEKRIAEDVLRILRFFRFHAAYGSGMPDQAALAACRAAAGRIQTLSRERITQEILKILTGPDPAGILQIMFENGVMTDLPHPDCDFAALNMLTGLQNRLGIVSVEARLVMLAAGQASHIPAFEKYLLFPVQQKKMLEQLSRAILSPTTIRERLYYFGRAVGGQSLLMLAALMDGKIDNGEIDVIRNWPVPVFPLGGSDLKALGVEEGPRMGEILKAVEEWWVEWGFQHDRARCIDRAREILKN